MARRRKRSSLAGVRERTCTAFLGGRPDVIHGMRFGGTRYKYDHGIFIDELRDDGLFVVAQAGSPKSRVLGKARSLAAAKKIACAKATQVPGDTWKRRASGYGR